MADDSHPTPFGDSATPTFVDNDPALMEWARFVAAMGQFFHGGGTRQDLFETCNLADGPEMATAILQVAINHQKRGGL